jgi:hypothetical protein
VSRFVLVQVNCYRILGSDVRTWFDLPRNRSILYNLLIGQIVNRRKANFFAVIDLNSNVTKRISSLPLDLPNSKRMRMISIVLRRIITLRRFWVCS